MSFAVFRKYEKPLLGAAVVFTVVVFAFFPSFGDMDAVLGGTGTSPLMGVFRVATTDEEREVTGAEFERTRQALSRLAGGRSSGVDDESVWAHLMLVEDARGAGLDVGDSDLVAALQEGFEGQLTAEGYANLWAGLGFASARSFESTLRDVLLVQHWTEALALGGSIVDASEVYQRWRVDNELFDLDVLVFADADPAGIADPGDEVLSAWFDGQPAYVRDRRFAEPARYGLAAAWLTLATDPASLPQERISALPAVDDVRVESQYQLLKASRFPDLAELDEPTRQILRGELTVVELVSAAQQAWIAQGESAVADGPPAPPRSGSEFVDHMAAWGLLTADPEAELGPDELAALPDVGSAYLSSRLLNSKVGDVRYFPPFGDEDRAVVLYVESVTPERPRTFLEARDAVLEAWRSDPAQVSAAARTFRDALAARARQVEEAAAILAPFATLTEEAVALAVAAGEAAGKPLEPAEVEALRKEQDATHEAEIDSRLQPFEHRAWEELVTAALAEGRARERLSYEGVSRAWRVENSGADLDRTTLDYYVKSNPRVFQMAVDGVTDVLRHVSGKASLVVRVAQRRFPDQSAMHASKESMERARQSLSAARRGEFMQLLMPARLMAAKGAENPWGHDLRVVQEPAAPVSGAADGAQPQPAGT